MGRGVARGGGAEGARAPSEFGRTVTPIQTRGGRLCPSHYCQPHGFKRLSTSLRRKCAIWFDKIYLWIIEPNCSSWWEIDYMPKPFVCCNFDNYSLCTHCQFNNTIDLGTKEKGNLFFSKKFDVIYESYLSTLNSTALGWGYNNTTFQRHK